MTIQDLKDKGLILLECISGSHAYGLNIPTSDVDIKGVFMLPKAHFYGLDYVPQVSDERNDTVYYELGRFIDLLAKNNPNILELLATPEDKIQIKHPVLNKITPELFLSKRCKDTFAGYAFTQIRKARGLNKKIVNPMPKDKRSVLDFCYILHQQGSIPLKKWCSMHGYQQERMGLVNIPHFKDTYGVYYDQSETIGYKGIMKKPTATSVLLSSIPKQEEPIAHLSFNQDGYIVYCKDYKEYWDWVKNRNEARYQSNLEHGKNYDAKNMMHTFRLLDMAEEILREGHVIVERPNRTELLSIRNGEWQYDDLIAKANEKMQLVEQAFKISQLPDSPDLKKIEAVLVEMRSSLYDS